MAVAVSLGTHVERAESARPSPVLVSARGIRGNVARAADTDSAANQAPLAANTAKAAKASKTLFSLNIARLAMSALGLAVRTVEGADLGVARARGALTASRFVQEVGGFLLDLTSGAMAQGPVASEARATSIVPREGILTSAPWRCSR